MSRRRKRLTRHVAPLLLCAFAIFGEGATGKHAAQPSSDECVSGGDCGFMPASARAYAAMCELELGVAPTVDCGAGVLIPITVDGVEVFEDPGLHECDKASLQVGDCMPARVCSGTQAWPTCDRKLPRMSTRCPDDHYSETIRFFL